MTQMIFKISRNQIRRLIDNILLMISKVCLYREPSWVAHWCRHGLVVAIHLWVFGAVLMRLVQLWAPSWTIWPSALLVGAGFGCWGSWNGWPVWSTQGAWSPFPQIAFKSLRACAGPVPKQTQGSSEVYAGASRGKLWSVVWAPCISGCMNWSICGQGGAAAGSSDGLVWISNALLVDDLNDNSCLGNGSLEMAWELRVKLKAVGCRWQGD